MRRIIWAVILSLGLTGCAVLTEGESSFEIYCGIRAKQHNEQPAKVAVESSVVDKIIDSLTDGKVSDAE